MSHKPEEGIFSSRLCDCVWVDFEASSRESLDTLAKKMVAGKRGGSQNRCQKKKINLEWIFGIRVGGRIKMGENGFQDVGY